MLSQISENDAETALGSGEAPNLADGRESAVSSATRRARGHICFSWQESRTNEKALQPELEGLEAPHSVRRFVRLGTSFGTGRLRWRFRFRAAEPADGVRTHAPEDGDLRSLGLLGFAVLVFVLRTNEQSVHEDVKLQDAGISPKQCPEK